MARLTVRLGDRLGTISPMIYGHFAEHLGRCIDEGFWVGGDSPIPNTRGIRNDTVAAMRRLYAPVIRWPGGCFADDYHWRDGIGPRDALVAAACFDVFNRHADVVTMANIAQTINVLQCVAQTQDDKMWLTPTYHAFDLYKDHMGNASVRVDLEDVPTVEARKADGAAVQLPVISASASVSPEKKTLILTLQNLHLTEPCDVTVRLRDGAAEKIAAKVLTAKDVRDHNGPETPNKVRPRAFETTARGSQVRATLPPHSLVSARVTLK